VSARRHLVAGVVALAGLALIASGQVVGNRSVIEDDLGSRSAAALDRAGLATYRVTVTGRDAEVAGPRAGLDRATAVVGDVRGVRAVSSRPAPAVAVAAALVAPAPSTSPAGEGSDADVEKTGSKTGKAGKAGKTGKADEDTALRPSPSSDPSRPATDLLPVGVTFEGRTIVVTGDVPSRKVARRVLDSVREGAAPVSWKVIDRVEVDGSVSGRAREDWYPGLTQLVATVPTDGKKIVVRFDGDHVVLRGHPRSQQVEHDLLDVAKQTVVAPFWVQDGLDVKG
jgi:hypothetical protein